MCCSALAGFFVAGLLLRGIMMSFVPGQVHIRVGRKDIGLDLGGRQATTYRATRRVKAVKEFPIFGAKLVG